jgi:probable HAF family extracellular repeat protein
MSIRHILIGLPLVAAMLAACSGPSSPGIAARSAGANSAAARTAGQAQYKMVRLDTLGGTIAAGISITNDDRISGFSGLSGNSVFHAAYWEDRSARDLGTLGGPNSAVEWPNHDEGVVVGISETSTTDPLGEHWSCSAFIPYSGDTCLGFVWHARSRLMKKLPTLGGNNGYAAGANSSGYVAGWAETSLHDSTCILPQQLQFEATVWNPNGTVSSLPPFANDPDSAATAIDDAGDVVGISGICQNAVGDLSAKHMVFWHAGHAIKIKSLGGEAWNTPAAINDAGEVVGFSDRPGDQRGNNPNFHAFSWARSDGVTNDLGVLNGDVVSEGLGVNASGVIVGISCATQSCSASRAFIFENGMMLDLNALVPAGSPHLVYANDINDNGEITGLAQNPVSGDLFAFRLVPSGNAESSAGMPARQVPQMPGGVRLRLGPFGKIVPML